MLAASCHVRTGGARVCAVERKGGAYPSAARVRPRSINAAAGSELGPIEEAPVLIDPLPPTVP
eukprot:scaffold1789_cov375-Prasinococcus_capsulatus_cf.AAC.24